MARLVRVVATFTIAVALGGLTPASPARADDGSGLGIIGGGLPIGFGTADPVGTVSSDGAWGLASSPYSLADIDPVSGALLGESVRDHINGDQTIVSDLYNADQLAIDAQRLAEQARAEAEAKRRAQLAALASGGQTEVGPDGCPTSAPASFIRGSVNVGELCAKSVAQARSPQAAKAIKFAMAQIGQPYCKPDSRAAAAPCNGDTNRFGKGPSRAFDCSGLMSAAYEAAGVTLGGTVSQNQPVNPPARQIPASEAMPGDLLQSNGGGHIGLALADGWQVHASSWNVGVIVSQRKNVTIVGAIQV